MVCQWGEDLPRISNHENTHVIMTWVFVDLWNDRVSISVGRNSDTFKVISTNALGVSVAKHDVDPTSVVVPLTVPSTKVVSTQGDTIPHPASQRHVV